MFDAALPLIQGSSFGFYPDTYEVETNISTVKRVKFSGTQAEKNYSYSIIVEMKSSSPLIHFTITSALASDLSISGYEPLAMLWMDTPVGNAVKVYQESPNYHSVGDSVYWNSCFPAAYVWAEGKESAVYFDMEPMDWFSFSNGVNRFKSVQIRCSERNGMTGIGMDLRRSMGAGTIIPAGDMVVDFYLYGKEKAATPTKMEALGVLADSFGECFDAEPVKLAQNFVDPGKTSYASLASTIAQQLLIEDVTIKSHRSTASGQSAQKEHGRTRPYLQKKPSRRLCAARTMPPMVPIQMTVTGRQMIFTVTGIAATTP